MMTQRRGEDTGRAKKHELWEFSARTSMRPAVLFGFAGSIAASGLVVADIIYAARLDGAYNEDWSFMKDIPETRLLWGNYLGLVVLPLCTLGVWSIYSTLARSRSRWALSVLLSGVGATVVGAAQHMTAMYVGMIHRFADDMSRLGGDAARSFIARQWQVMFSATSLLFLVLGVCFAAAVLSSRTPYPKWVALGSPVVAGPVFVALSAVPVVGPVLYPAAGAMSLATMFLASTLVLARQRS